MKKKVGIVADDITGANDIGIMFAKNSYSVGIFPYEEDLKLEEVEELDVIIIDTNSRFDKPDVSRDKVYRSTKKLMEIPCDLYHNKTCSVFRGNIGVEFDAMQEALGIENSMVVLGFPKNGRTTVDGIHYVNGVKLEDSQFNKDPIHPMTESNLISILSKQTSKRVGSLNYSILDKDIKEIKEKIKELKRSYNYIIFDVRDQKDLSIISEAIKDEKNICGSSAIGEELPKVWGSSLVEKHKARKYSEENNNGVLIIAGSLTPQTFKQVEYLKNKGCKSVEFDTLRIYNEKTLKEQIEILIKVCSSTISKGQDILVYTTNELQNIQETKRLGYEKGLDDKEIGKIISSALSEVVKGVRKDAAFNKIIVAGGDTSAAISQSLGIKKMIIIEELEPGIPDMYGYNKDEEYIMVLKSGSFGSEGFLALAAERLKQL